jgi:DASH complex subunit SPC19
VDSLLGRVSNYLDKLERREQSLIAKYDLNEGRLSRDTGRSSTSAFSRPSGGGGEAAPPAPKLNPLEELKYRQLRQKKERLSYAVDRLTLQAQQRERQLRMSMAAPHQLG